MNSYAWLSKLTAESMSKQGKGGCIIQMGSIYGIVGQDVNVYQNTKIRENMTYSVSKAASLILLDK